MGNFGKYCFGYYWYFGRVGCCSWDSDVPNKLEVFEKYEIAEEEFKMPLDTLKARYPCKTALDSVVRLT